MHGTMNIKKFYELLELHKLNIYCRKINKWTVNQTISFIVQKVLQVSAFSLNIFVTDV